MFSYSVASQSIDQHKYGSSLARSINSVHVPSMDALFEQFDDASHAAISKFKTDYIKMVERQSRELEFDNVDDSSLDQPQNIVFRIEHPPSSFPFSHFDNVNLISYPSPNIDQASKIGSQLMVTVNYENHLNVIQFFNHSTIFSLNSFYTLLDVRTYEAVKIKSFVEMKPTTHTQPRSPDFRLFVLILYKSRFPQFMGSSDQILTYAFDGFTTKEPSNRMVSELTPLSSAGSALVAENVIGGGALFMDFDVIFHDAKYYMALISYTSDSNTNYQLRLHSLRDTYFDFITLHHGEYIYNANRVKLARLNSGIYFICSYARNELVSRSLNGHAANALNIFKYEVQITSNNGKQEHIEHKINKYATVQNETFIGNVKGLFHMNDVEDYFFVVKKDSIVVYWWDGMTLIYFDTIVERELVRSFGLAKMDKIIPLIVSSDGQELTIHYKEFDQFTTKKYRNVPIPDGYELKKIQVFSWADKYYVWTLFHQFDYFPDATGQQSRKRLVSFGKISHVTLDEPEDSGSFRTYMQCMANLRSRLADGIKRSANLSTIAQQLLVISPTRPEVNVDVYVDEIMRSQKAPPALNLVIPNSNIVEGKSIEGMINSTMGRLTHIREYMWSNVMMRSINQTIISPVEYQNEVSINNQLIISQVNDLNFRLNDIPLEVYESNTLKIVGNQMMEYINGGEIVFKNGLIVNELNVDNVNGRNIRNAVLAVQPFITQSITGDHRFKHLELVNGTTSPIINNVRLTELFQDTPEIVQLMRSSKSFTNLTIENISTDSSFNGWNMKIFESQAIWLDNDHITTQNFPGNSLEFVGGVYAPKMKIGGKINQRLDLTKFSKNVARSYQELILQGPIYIANRANVWKDLTYSGLVNGNLDFLRDVILLNWDQDFTSTSNGSRLEFDSFVSMKNVSTGLLNGFIQTEQFVLRQDLLNSSLYSSSQRSTLTHKGWLNNLYVNNDVTLGEGITINGVDISDLYRKLDSVTAFNTPLQVDQIEIGGSLQATNFNGYSSELVHRIASTRLSKTIPQTINIPISYSQILTKNLIFNVTGSGRHFPKDYINQSEALISDINIYGRKWFTGHVKVGKIELGPLGRINGHKISQLYEAMVKNDTSFGLNKTEDIYGKKRFGTLVVKGNIFVDDGMMNDCFIDKAVTIDREQRIMKSFSFKHIVVDHSSFLNIIDLRIINSLSGHNFQNFLDEVVIFGEGHNLRPIDLRNKNFGFGINLFEFIPGNGTFGGIRIGQLMQSALMIDSGVHQVTSSIYFNNAFFEKIEYFKSIGQLERKMFENAILKSSNPIKIDPWKTFHKDIFARKSTSLGGYINQLNLTHVVHNTLMRYGDQTVYSKHIFLRPVHFVNVHIHPHVLLNDRRFEEIVRLDQTDIWFNNDIIFEKLNQIEQLTVHGYVDQCNLTVIKQDAIRRKPDSTFDLHVSYVVPWMHVKQNVILPKIVNEQLNFIGHIALVNDLRPIVGELTFQTDLVTERLIVNNKINEVNVTELLHDSVYSHIPSVITGHKTFMKPLKIYGFVRQHESPGSPKMAQLRVGHLNQVNVSHLLTTTVMTDKAYYPISGNKNFFGTIRFVGPIRVRTLNNAPVPQGYYLRNTDELITGETYFTKRILVNQNLRARMVNNFNLTQFVMNCFFLVPPKIPLVREVDHSEVVTSVLTFIDGIHIKNLTIHHKINDIPVSDILHRDSNAKVYGYKVFEKPIVVRGNLDIGTVNSIDFDADLKRQWIDTRDHSIPINITGQIVLRKPTNVDHLKITDRINNFRFDQIDKNYFENLNHGIVRVNRTIDDEIKNLDRIERSVEEHSRVDYLDDLNYFSMVQHFHEPIEAFHPVSYFSALSSTGIPFYQTESLLIEKIRRLSPYCSQYVTNYYETFATHPNSRSSKRLNEVNLSHFGILPSNLNMRSVMINSISAKFADDSAIIHSIRPHRCVDNQSLAYDHRIGFFYGRYFPKYHLPLLEFNLQRSAILNVKMFSTIQRNLRYLVVLSEDYQIKLYKVDLKVGKFEKIQNIAKNVIDFDLIELPTKANQSSILLSMIYNSQNDPLQPQLMRWTGISSNQFQIYPNYQLNSLIDGFLLKTKFIQNGFGIFLLQAIGERTYFDEFSQCEKLPKGFETERSHIDIWQWTIDGRLEHWQRFAPHSIGSVRAIESVQVGHMWYLFTLVGNHLETFQYRGYNRFESIHRYYIQHANSLTSYWNDNNLYLAIGSSIPNRSQLLAAVLRSFGEENHLINANNWYEALEQMKQFNNAKEINHRNI